MCESTRIGRLLFSPAARRRVKLKQKTEARLLSKATFPMRCWSITGYLEAPLNISSSLPNSSSIPFIPLGGERQRESKVGPCPRTQHWPRMRSACSVVQRSIHKATARATGLLLCLKRRKNCGQPTVYTYSALLITLSGM